MAAATRRPTPIVSEEGFPNVWQLLFAGRKFPEAGTSTSNSSSPFFIPPVQNVAASIKIKKADRTKGPLRKGRPLHSIGLITAAKIRTFSIRLIQGGVA